MYIKILEVGLWDLLVCKNDPWCVRWTSLVTICSDGRRRDLWSTVFLIARILGEATEYTLVKITWGEQLHFHVTRVGSVNALSVELMSWHCVGWQRAGSWLQWLIWLANFNPAAISSLFKNSLFITLSCFNQLIYQTLAFAGLTTQPSNCIKISYNCRISYFAINSHWILVIANWNQRLWFISR